MQLNESLNTILNYEILKKNGWGDTKYGFSLKDIGLDAKIFVVLNYVSEDGVNVSFNVGKNNNVSSIERTTSFAIFATITEIVQNFVEENNIKYVEARADIMKKVFMYEKLFKRFGNGWSINREADLVKARRIV